MVLDDKMTDYQTFALAFLFFATYVYINITFKLYSFEWIAFLGITTFFYWLLLVKTFSKENYTPYRNTGGCGLGDGGYVYLDDYNNQQFYLQNPRVYPTSDNFFKALVKNKKEEQEFVRQQRIDIEKQYEKALGPAK